MEFHPSRLTLLHIIIPLLLSLALIASPAGVWTSRLAAQDDVPGTSGSTRHGAEVYLHLRAGSFDPLAGEPQVPPGMRRLLTVGQPGLRLVQFPGPIQDEWYAAMEKAGLGVISYIPDYAYLVWGDDRAVGALADAAPLRWSGLYHPAYALHPALADPDALPAEVEVTVQVYDHPGAEETLQAILARARAVLRPPYPVLVYRNLGVRVAAEDLPWLASLPDVVNVEPFPRYRMLDEIQCQILAGNLNAAGTQPSGPGYLAWLTARGFPNTPDSYPIIDITDDGIDDGDTTPTHSDFYVLGNTANPDRLVYNYNWTSDPSADGGGGHGNINASIAVGYNDRTGFPYEDSGGYNYGLGISPFGRVAGSKVFNNAGDWDTDASNTSLINNSYSLGARISSNSWGEEKAGGNYDALAQEYDRLVRDARPTVTGNQEMSIIFAAGNDGPSSNTVSPPGTAKNVITVGAAENYRPNWTDGCGVNSSGADSAQDIASFSSRGPTDDGRVKPDLVAPGTHIAGAASQSPNYNGEGVCDPYWPSGQTLYAASSGTSHSTPAVAGAASLVYYWYQTRYGSGQPPSPAMVKAYLINSTRYLTGTGAGGNLPSNSQGFGEVHLGRAFDNTPRVLVDQTHIFGNSGQVYTVSGSVADSGKPFRVTLAWTDAPGPTTGNAYVNNLDLAVVVGGQTYRGNVFSGGTSIPGGSADPRNNVESVFLPAGVSGSFTVTITATNIAGDGVPGNADPTDQDFALVVYNAIPEPTGLLRGTVSDASTGNPIVGARVVATAGVTRTGTATTGAGGLYSLTLPAATYIVTATAFGYLPSTATGVVVTAGMTTTQNFSLTPAPRYVLSGTVSDALAGWPLYASLEITDGVFYSARLWTDPVSGFYSTTLPGGTVYILTARAWVTGYLPLARTVGPLTANRTENFTLTVDPVACNAPGYYGDIGFAENFDSATPPALPTGWAKVDVSGTAGDWATSAGTVHPSGASAHSPPNLAYFNSYSASSGSSTRLYRTVGTDMRNRVPTLRFWMYHDTGYSTSNDRLQVQVSTNGGASWTNVGSPIPRYDGSTGWKEHVVDLSAYGNQPDLRVGFLGISGYGNDIHIDDVVLGGGCVPRPGGLVVGNVYDGNTGAPLAGALVSSDGGYTTTTAVTEDPAVPDSFYTLFSPPGLHVFTATLSGYGAAVSTTNVVQSSTVRLDFYLTAPRLTYAPASLSVVLTRGLTATLPLTLSNSGGLTLTFALEEWSGAGTALLSEGFESGQVPPPGWSEWVQNAGANWEVLSSGARSGSYAASVSSSNQPQDEWLLTPEMNLSSATLSFWSFGDPGRCRDTYNYCDLFVWLVVGDVGGADDVYLGKADDAWPSNRTWAQSTFDLTPKLPGGPVRIGFEYYGQNGAQVGLDDVRVEGIGSVDIPWLSENPTTGVVPPGSRQIVSVAFDSGGMAPGPHSAALRIRTNDPARPQVTLPVTMTVVLDLPHRLYLPLVLRNLGHSVE
ncbi:MAG: S8 family serine peptidase [Anaerolineae bacterium]|nr:S8 family serine peptidase [Anaerolineae bacterium]